MDVVKDMVQNAGRVSPPYDLYLIYGQLSAWTGPEVDSKTREPVLQFLADVLTSVPGYGYEYPADQTLCAASEQWRKSYEREAMLERFKDVDNTTYYSDQLKALRALPEAERTHVEVHPLRSASPAPPSPPQPEAPASTNTLAASATQPAP